LFAGLVVIPNALDSLLWQFVAVLMLLNIVMVVFNMIPAFPMDGGRVLRAILANWMGTLSATRIAVAVGTVMAILIGFVGMFVLGNPWLLFIALFVILAGHQELAALEWEQRQRHAAEEDALPPMLASQGRNPGGSIHMTVILRDPARRI